MIPHSIPTYHNNLKVSQALKIFFDKYHFADGGYHLKWFHIKAGIINIPLPNIKARVEVAKIHDIHHVLTGYEATLCGEAEIAGWEIASGCDKFIVAWFFNMGSFFYGMLFFPVPLFKAFVRGSKVKTNYYHSDNSYEALLKKTVGEMRLEVDPVSASVNPSPTVRDYFNFAFYGIFITLLVIAIICIFELIGKGILDLFH
jgi:hypothetical protein